MFSLTIWSLVVYVLGLHLYLLVLNTHMYRNIIFTLQCLKTAAVNDTDFLEIPGLHVQDVSYIKEGICQDTGIFPTHSHSPSSSRHITWRQVTVGRATITIYILREARPAFYLPVLQTARHILVQWCGGQTWDQSTSLSVEMNTSLPLIIWFRLRPEGHIPDMCFFAATGTTCRRICCTLTIKHLTIG